MVRAEWWLFFKIRARLKRDSRLGCVALLEMCIIIATGLLRFVKNV